MKLLGIIVLVLSAQLSRADDVLITQKFINFRIRGERNLPEKVGVELLVDGRVVRAASATESIDPTRARHWRTWEVGEFAGRTAQIRLNDNSTTSKLEVDQLAQSDEPKSPPINAATLFAETYRPQFHFTAESGWLNDANGLLHYKGAWHLFHQHKPPGSPVVVWGHAVSDDLLHWRHQPTAIPSDGMDSNASGSGLVDWDNASGLKRGDDPPIMLFFTRMPRTGSGPKATQCLAFSTDGGRTFEKFAGNPLLRTTDSKDRDPKVFFHKPTRAWFMVLSLSRNNTDREHATYGLFRSRDLKSWELLQEIGPGAWYWECPDMFELPVDNDPSRTKWLLLKGSGDYIVGAFDGERFRAETEPIRTQWGGSFYGAQTFNDAPGGRRVHIGWMNSGAKEDKPNAYPGMPFNQQMSFPRELTLRSTPAGPRLLRQPIAEIERLYAKTHRWENQPLRPGENPLAGIGHDLLDIELELELREAKQVELKLRGATITYDVAKSKLYVFGRPLELAPVEGKLILRVLLDRTSIELFANRGEVTHSNIFFPDPSNRAVALNTTGGPAHIQRLEVRELRSIWPSDDGKLLYNGIRLPKNWPPRVTDTKNRKPRPVPYLVHPPAVIPIDVGRQLFVDDFLIEKTDLKRTFHYPERYAGNPVLKPETPLELNGGRLPCAMLFQDGLWFDPKDRLFKLWYHGGWFDGTALATSKDGLYWERPQFDVVKGTNRVLPTENHGQRDGCTVWLDHFTTDPAQRFKMFLYERPENKFGGQIFTSPDGVHWTGPTRTSRVGDNTSLSYNPFRKKWIYSVRTSLDGRTRSYRECDDFVRGATWRPDELVYWAGADELDLPDPQVGDRTQLYNLDAIAYESLMLGVFAIHRGPANEVCAKQMRPKLTDLELGYSRDGFHWHRPDRTPFLAGTRKEGDWDRAYLHSAASICTIVGDKLYFYYSAFSGISPKLGSHMYAGGATGVAFLRRDGFASMNADEKGGTLMTRPVTFKGKHLFVNLDASKGELRAELLDETDNIITPFTAENCVAVVGDSTCQRITWKGADDLSQLSGRRVKLRFHLTRGQLYAFWVTPDANGASYGHVAAGGPEFDGPADRPKTDAR